ncbi:MAG: phosphomannomutase/phosphoglucomutase [Thermoanaerobaculia bacterium]|nr:phosphomannomutase/phosphoglucomutase [Thermoanaerobaculia bacterium]
MAGIFKAYDVRGIVPDELDTPIAYKIGRAFRALLDPEDDHDGAPVVVSNDMRASSGPLKAALIEGLLDSGLDVVDIGLQATPTNYFAIGHLKTAGGIQVTASHNPARYNGFKMSRRDAKPVSGDHGIGHLEKLVLAGDFPPPPAQRGTHTEADVSAAYAEHVLAHLRRPEGAKRLKVVVDCANGMGAVDRPILERLGIELIPLYFELDGTFPNHEANPLKLENLRDLSKLVLESGADLGIAFDGDADRAAFVDERGEPVGSDLSTALVAGELLEREPGKVVVYDLRSSHAVAEHITAKGGIPVRERVGHSFIKATLRERGGAFGGELAGHYYFRDNFYADCALLAVIEMLNLLWKEGKPLSQLVAPLLAKYRKTPEINFVVEDKAGKIAELAARYADAKIDYLDGITFEYPTWWANVRPSNTEPYLRLVLEASSDEELAAREQELVAILGEPAE